MKVFLYIASPLQIYFRNYWGTVIDDGQEVKGGGGNGEEEIILI